jgi:hypothetical protein
VEQDDELIPEESLDKNQIVEQGLIQELCGTFDICSSISTVSSTDTNSSCNGSENMISGSAQLSYLFDTVIKSGQQEILDWYNYSLEFESKVDILTADGRIKDNRGIDNYNFAFAQSWDSSCSICNEKHGNYGLHGEWYRNRTEYCLTCNSLSNKFKFAIVA